MSVYCGAESHAWAWVGRLERRCWVCGMHQRVAPMVTCHVCDEPAARFYVLPGGATAFVCEPCWNNPHLDLTTGRPYATAERAVVGTREARIA